MVDSCGTTSIPSRSNTTCPASWAYSAVVGHARLGRFGQQRGSIAQQVHDGDTVTLEAEGNLGVRFLGIDAPEVSVPLPPGTH